MSPLDPLLQVFGMIGVIFKYFWWLILPLGLYSIFRPVWGSYVVNVLFFGQEIKMTLLKINLPRDMQSNPKSMENTLAALLGTATTITHYQKAMTGRINDYFSFEIVGQEGDVSFYIMTPHRSIRIIEKAIYGQFPDVEIVVGVEDYFNRIPATVPDENWNMWGAKMVLSNPNCAPIRTFREFEDPVAEDLIDPLSTIFEAMSTLGPGEHLIYQIQISIPDADWRKKGEAEIDRILKIYNMSPLTDLSEGTYMRVLPPHQQEYLKGIHRKMEKTAFNCQLVFAYIARREVFSPVGSSVVGGTLRQFELGNTMFVNDKYYSTSAYQFMGKSRKRYRQRRLIKLMQERDTQGTQDVLNVEEIATIWHFPTQLIKTPFVPRTDSRTSPAPFNLPVSE
jgi:hypothetical protein